MFKNSCLYMLLFSLFLTIFPGSGFAESNMKKRDQVFQFMEEAFQAQVSLSEKERTMDEIDAVLDPYFTEEYKAKFIEENVVEENGRYLTYGTDFAQYYIPFYEFSEKTKVVNMGKEIYIIEYFPGNSEGPVSYESHYEGLKLIKDKGEWKVAEYLMDGIPQEVINSAYPEKAEKRKTSSNIQDKETFTEKLIFGPSLSSLHTLLGFDVLFGSEMKTIFFGFM